MDSATRAYYGYKEAVVSIVVNVLLSVMKLAAGMHINSIALITDGLHSLSDIITSFVVIIGFKSSEKPPDREHPFGHGRFENITSLIISIFLVVVGVEFFISSIERLYHPQPVHGNFFFFGFVLVTIVVKEGLAQYSTHLSHKIDSAALLADAWHHRSDALSSLPAAFGVLASIYGVYIVDSLSGAGVSIIIMYMGYKIARDAVSTLLGEAPSTTFVEQIKELAHQEKVTDVYDIFVHDYGTKKVVSLTVTVEPMGLPEAHNVADSIEKKIAEGAHASAVVHVEGFAVDTTMKEEIYKTVKEYTEVVSCHGVHIGEKIDFHILVHKDMKVEKVHALTHRLQEEVERRFNKAAIIHVEPCIEQCDYCEQECEARPA
jgi:cation diffusion facilitator family transporter